MKKPTCECFGRRTEGVENSSDGEAKTCLVAIEVSDAFADTMSATGICPDGYEYAMVTAIVLVMKSVSAQMAEGDPEKENAAFHAMIPWIAEAVRERGDEMHREAQNDLRRGMH